MDDTILRIAQIKAVPVKGDLSANFDTLMATLDALAFEELDVVVTPECFLDGYVSTEKHVTRDSMLEYGVDPAASPYVKEAAAWAAANETWLVFGCVRLEAGSAYNTALIIDRGGRLIGHYDKTHCQTHDRKFTPGDSLPVYRADFGLFGVMICADRRWPETVRTLALKGARVIFNPTYGMCDELNLRMMRTRSYESEVYIVFTHPRQALITGPGGEIVCNDESAHARYTVTTVDLGEVDRKRAGPSAHLKDRRLDLYELG